MSKEMFGHVFRSAFETLDKLPPLDDEKNPLIAAFCGFWLGGVGLGLYFRSWTDFIFPFVIAFVLLIGGIPTGGILLLLTPFCWAIYGYRRATASNAKLKGRGGYVMEAEIVAEPPRLRPTSRQLPESVQTRLLRLDDLLHEGILTPSEHAEKRAQLLRQN